jgi:branched-chain amino acid transport system substrate-binding protein
MGWQKALAIVASVAFAAGITTSAAQEIVIGVAGPMTGDLAEFGVQLRKGAEQAVTDINAAGGVLGKKLRLEIGDDVCDPKQAVSVAAELAGKGVKFVAGHFCSGSSIPASKVYQEENVIMISPSSTNPELTDSAAADGWQGVLRVCGRDDKQGSFAAEWVVKNMAGKKVAIVHDKSTAGKGVVDEFKRVLNSLGTTEVIYEAITAGEQDYTPLITKLQSVGTEVLYYGGYHPEAALIVRQAAEKGLKAPLISSDGMATKEFWTLAGPAAAGTMFTNAVDPRKHPASAAIVEKFRASGYDPEGYTLNNYAAVQVWTGAVQKAGTTDTKAVMAALRGQTWQTVMGPATFDEKGDNKDYTYVMFVFADGGYREVGY